MKNKKIIITILIIVLALIAVIVLRTKPANKVIRDSIYYVQDQKSFASNVKFSIGIGSDSDKLLSGVSQLASGSSISSKDKYSNMYSIKYNADVEYKNGCTYFNGDSNQNIFGTKSSTPIEMYTVKDKKNYTTYSLNSDTSKWTKSTETSTMNNFTTKDLLTFLNKINKDNLKKITSVKSGLTNYTVKFDFTKLSSDEWADILEINSNDTNTISQLINTLKSSYGVSDVETFTATYVVSKTNKPVSFSIKLQGSNEYDDNNDSYKQYLKLGFNMNFTKFGNVNISLPDKVKNNATENKTSSIDTTDSNTKAKISNEK